MATSTNFGDQDDVPVGLHDDVTVAVDKGERLVERASLAASVIEGRYDLGTGSQRFLAGVIRALLGCDHDAVRLAGLLLHVRTVRAMFSPSLCAGIRATTFTGKLLLRGAPPIIGIENDPRSVSRTMRPSVPGRKETATASHSVFPRASDGARWM